MSDAGLRASFATVLMVRAARCELRARASFARLGSIDTHQTGGRDALTSSAARILGEPRADVLRGVLDLANHASDRAAEPELALDDLRGIEAATLERLGFGA